MIPNLRFKLYCQVLELRPGMADHEARCGCREVQCPNSECGARLQVSLQWDLQSSFLQCYVVQVRQIFSHIKESHKDALTRDDKEATDFTLTCLLQEGFQEREGGLSTHSLSTHSLSTHYLLARWAPGSP